MSQQGDQEGHFQYVERQDATNVFTGESQFESQSLQDSRGTGRKRGREDVVGRFEDDSRASKRTKTATSSPGPDDKPSRKYTRHHGMPHDEMLLRCRGYFADVDKPMSIQDVFEELKCIRALESNDSVQGAGTGTSGKSREDRALYNDLIKKEWNALNRAIKDRAGAEEAKRFLKQRREAKFFDPWGQMLQYGHWHPLVSSDDEVGIQNTAARRRRADRFGFWTPAVEEIPEVPEGEVDRVVESPPTELDDEATQPNQGDLFGSTTTGVNPETSLDPNGSSYQHAHVDFSIDKSACCIGPLDNPFWTTWCPNDILIAAGVTSPVWMTQADLEDDVLASVEECGLGISPPELSQSEFFLIDEVQGQSVLPDMNSHPAAFGISPHLLCPEFTEPLFSVNAEPEECQLVPEQIEGNAAAEIVLEEPFEWPFDLGPGISAQEVLELLQ